MEFFTFVDLEAARVVRKAYIDALISNMIRLETDPYVIVWIHRLRDCRERDWDDEVRAIIRNAILAYNTRWTVLYGGSEVSQTIGKFFKKAVKGATAALEGKEGEGTTGKFVSSAVHYALGTKPTVPAVPAAPVQHGGEVEDELHAALQSELRRMREMERMMRK